MRENIRLFSSSSLPHACAFEDCGFERHACALIGQPRSTQRRRPKIRDDEDALAAAIIQLARTYRRHGYRRIYQMLKADGWNLNYKRVYRIWPREGLKVRAKQSKRGPGRPTHGIRALAVVSQDLSWQSADKLIKPDVPVCFSAL